VLTHPRWSALPGIRHGFLDRSECGAHASGDAWATMVAAAGVPLPVCTVRQVHGTRVVTADRRREAPAADGVVTSAPGLAVGVVTADCVPALMLARERGVVASVHAGWRGAAAGVLEAALAHLDSAFGVRPQEVEVCLGPAVGPCCYRVGSEVRAAFQARTGGLTAPAWRETGDALMLDLRLAERRLLEAAGVRHVSLLGPCTACTPSYASYRRDGAGAGRQLSFIART
jgi:YfiH family protein